MGGSATAQRAGDAGRHRRLRGPGDGYEPAAEKAARAGLQQAWTGLAVGSIPAAKQKVRPGRLIVVTVRNRPASPSNGGGTSRPRGEGNDDDDFNVPGWLCPTRFC